MVREELYYPWSRVPQTYIQHMRCIGTNLGHEDNLATFYTIFLHWSFLGGQSGDHLETSYSLETLCRQTTYWRQSGDKLEAGDTSETNYLDSSRQYMYTTKHNNRYVLNTQVCKLVNNKVLPFS
jgi:hypothetical protein